MILIIALVVGLLFATGVQLMSRRDAVMVTAGTLLVSNAVIVLLVLAGWRSTVAPFTEEAKRMAVADPLVQALALTAVVIGLGTTVLLLRVVLALERTHHSVDVKEIANESQFDD